ncbi:hypothetical protein HG536_0H00530 [Torulaspora globosa]|uniref:ATPase expression protein 2, mitochondrial n=1 Tax=Torulaspora globosa TaxID=48254 RepID=A0A7G3ZME2_9SACH|nr:uncharacterized protein HG536_0H00530 [Torulaspora globosa]QLL34678.1 hypothetical protein HG536_0H00530 [Torulaspora globosa]
MLKQNHGVAKILRAFSSTLAMDHAAAEAMKIGISHVMDNAAGVIPSTSETTAVGATSTIRDTLSRLEDLHAVSRISYRSRRKESIPTNKLRADLRKRQHVRCLIDIMIQDHLNKHFISKLFHDNEISKSEFSMLVNRLLKERNLEAKLSNIVPDTVHTEILFRLFEIYCEFALQNPAGKLTVSELHDVNLFIKTFIDEAQLGKAQRCLQFVLDRQGLESTLHSGDVWTIIHFLQLRCGAVVKFWDTVQGDKRMLGQNSTTFKQPKTFKSWNNQAFSKVISVILKDKAWLSRNSTELSSAIIYSLANMGQAKLIEQFIELKWGVPQSGSVKLHNAVAPEAGTLIAIVSSFCLKASDMSKGLAYLDQLLKQYPEIKLEKLFWRRLLQLSFQSWDKHKDKKGQVCHASWEIMKQWHDEKSMNMSYDHGTLELLYQLFQTTNNGREAMEVISRCFGSLYARQGYQRSASEMGLLQKYQKLALKTMALKGNYHKPLQFIKEWHVDRANQQLLIQYFTRQRQRYILRQKRIGAKRDELQTQYDAMEEEDMLLGRLW